VTAFPLPNYRLSPLSPLSPTHSHGHARARARYAHAHMRAYVRARSLRNR
jgi:hypothetical protein